MATVSYGMRITNASRVLDKTVQIYRDAVNYIVEVALLRFEDISSLQAENGVPKEKVRMAFVESLIHTTQSNAAVYKKFDQNFYKFPSYLRRAAIFEAVGIVSAYKSLVKNWEDGGRKGNRPRLNKTRDSFPCFYKGNTFVKGEDEKSPSVRLKIYNGSDWVWADFSLRRTDFMYAKNNLADWKQSAPTLAKRGHRYELRFAYTTKASCFPCFKKDIDVQTALGVDLGINTDATCSVVRKDGTVAGQRFINSPVEKDRLYGLLNAIKKAQQNGNYKTPRLWRLANNYNTAISIHTAVGIVNFARESGAEVIVFEYLQMKGKKHGSCKQKLALWRKREVQHRVENLAKRCGIRVSYICAVNTSRLAYDGSGKVLRGKEAGLDSYSLCKFKTGKVYNCDLSASKNIAARYFVRVLLKIFPAAGELPILAKCPGIGRRTSCTLATLISAVSVICTFKDSLSEATAEDKSSVLQKA